MLPHETLHRANPTSTLTSSPLLDLIAAMAGSSKKPRDAIALSQVQTLTLRGHNTPTTSRRVSSVPQTKCISHASLCALVEPKLDVMRCENMGSSYDDADVEWSCSASLPEELKLGSTDVICEGYESSDDPFVLKGSCGVEYRVVLTDKGEERYPDLSTIGRREAQGGEGGSWAPFLFFLGVVGIMVILSYLNGTGNAQNERRPRGAARNGGGGNGWGGGGGGGWDPDTGGFQDEDEPPPPYPGGRKSTGGSSRQTRSQTAQEGWRPGFWSGLAAGGAGAYAAGRATGGRNNQQQEPRRDDNRRGWFGGRSGQSSSGSGSGGGASGTSYESTGFGSTSRR